MQYNQIGVKVFNIDESNAQISWESIRSECAFLTDWGIGLLRHGLNGHVKTILLEQRYICKDYRNLYSNFYTKKFINRPEYCSRLHFFSSPGLTIEQILFEPGKHNENYIGYSVIQPIKDRCIGRTIVDPRKVGLDINNYFCLSNIFRVNVNGAQYTVQGYPYMAQSAEATVCAHSALWGACRYLSERYSIYKELYPYDLVELTSSGHGRTAPYRGMTYSDYSEILSEFGCYPVILRPRTEQEDWKIDKESFYDLYSYVESGFPVLTSFSGHVSTIIGHTIKPDSDCVLPGDERFVNSFNLLNEFIVVDDNFFPYQLLGYNGGSRNYGTAYGSALSKTPSIDSIFAAVIPLPEKAFLPPVKARNLATKYLSQPELIDNINAEIEELGYSKDTKLIFRAFLTSNNSFKRRKLHSLLGANGEPDELAQFPLDLQMPHFVWVIEISPYELYRQGYSVGEIILDASANYYEAEYIYMRIGKSLHYQSRCARYTSALGKFSQYTHNLGER